MGNGIEGGTAGESSLPIEQLPKSALQALYHAVTGKTENYTKVLEESVIIDFPEVERLHHLIKEQLQHYETLSPPTITVVVKTDDHKTITYSSWERFKVLEVAGKEITSEVSIKYEVLLKLPNTPVPQRFVLTVGIDSSLPVICKRREVDDDTDFLGVFLVMRRKWKTVTISIDFVDFLIAKIFVGHIEEWFSGLNKTPTKPLTVFLLSKYANIQSILGQSGKLGAAAFIAGYTLFNQNGAWSPVNLLLGLAITILIWALVVIFTDSVDTMLRRRLTNNIVPSVILFSRGDKEAYDEVISSLTSPAMTLIRAAGSPVGALIINIISSYIYSELTRP